MSFQIQVIIGWFVLTLFITLFIAILMILLYLVEWLWKKKEKKENLKKVNTINHKFQKRRIKCIKMEK